MNKQMIVGEVVMILIIIVSGCTSVVLKCDPVVIVTDKNYTSDPSSVPYNEIHDEFAENYSGEDLCSELRDDIIESMREKATELGEDAEILYQCVKTTYSDWEERPKRIPCYAEKCIYENESIWAIAFNRANSFNGLPLSHFDLFFVSNSTYEIVYHTGCY